MLSHFLFYIYDTLLFATTEFCITISVESCKHNHIQFRKHINLYVLSHMHMNGMKMKTSYIFINIIIHIELECMN